MVAGPPGTLVTHRSPLKERPSRPTRLESVEGLFRSGRIVDDVRRIWAGLGFQVATVIEE